MRKIVISDLDGTIAKVDHRRHLVEGEKKDWRAFYAACVDDEPNIPVIHSLMGLKQVTGSLIVIVSARSKEVEQETKNWLRKHRISYDLFFMLREDGDYTSDVELKKKFLDQFQHKEQILCVFDDRDSVVKMWRDNGLTCFQVAPGDF